MDYILTPHAKQRMVERLIPDKLIAATLRNPTKVLYDSRGRLLFKKLYQKKGQTRLLLIAGIKTGNSLRIVTVIDTSKLRKYL